MDHACSCHMCIYLCTHVAWRACNVTTFQTPLCIHVHMYMFWYLYVSVCRDTAGQERFHTFTKQFFRGTQVRTFFAWYLMHIYLWMCMCSRVCLCTRVLVCVHMLLYVFVLVCVYQPYMYMYVCTNRTCIFLSRSQILNQCWSCLHSGGVNRLHSR